MLTTKRTRIGLAVILAGAATTAALPAMANPEIKLRGRIHMDAGYFDDDSVQLDDGFSFRRTRMGMSIKIDDQWSAQIEYDFAENGTSANDVKLMYNPGKGRISIGQFKVPMGLNELTSSNNITFIERASNSNVIVDSRRIGVGYDLHESNYGFSGMVFGRGIGGKETGDMPMGVAARFYFNPIREGDTVLHLGISGAHENRRDYQSLRYRDRPEARPDGDRLIDTGSITGVDKTTKVGLEFAYKTGPFSVEAEYLRADIKRDAGPEPTFDGYHIQASYVLTGESRGYRDGVFRGITPKNKGTGAWEVAARLSNIDLIDSGFQGGEQQNITLGLNYYANANVRFMFNYIRVDVEDSNASVKGTIVGDDSPNIFLLRAQVNF